MDLAMLRSKYSVEEHILGQGTYGKVHLVVDKATNKRLAMKQLTNIEDDEASSTQIAREIQLLYSLQHKNIISLFDVRMIRNNMFIITEYCEYDLHTIIYDNAKAACIISNYAAYITIVFQILEAVRYMHAAGVIHRDIKPANVLLSSNLEVKLCDFGMSRVETDIDGDRVDLTEYMVTRWYRAPELVLNPGKYGKAQDIWAIGCTLSELINRAPLFPGKDTVHQLQLIVQVMGKPTAMDLNFDMPPNSRHFVENLRSQGEAFEGILHRAHAVDPNLCCLMREMLQFNPNRRVTAEEAVSNPMFAHHRKEVESEAPVPISWRTYQETMLNIQEAKSNRARLRAIRECVSCLQEDLDSRIVDDSFEDNGVKVEVLDVQSIPSSECGDSNDQNNGKEPVSPFAKNVSAEEDCRPSSPIRKSPPLLKPKTAHPPPQAPAVNRTHMKSFLGLKYRSAKSKVGEVYPSDNGESKEDPKLYSGGEGVNGSRHELLPPINTPKPIPASTLSGSGSSHSGSDRSSKARSIFSAMNWSRSHKVLDSTDIHKKIIIAPTNTTDIAFETDSSPPNTHAEIPSLPTDIPKPIFSHKVSGSSNPFRKRWTVWK